MPAGPKGRLICDQSDTPDTKPDFSRGLETGALPVRARTWFRGGPRRGKPRLYTAFVRSLARGIGYEDTHSVGGGFRHSLAPGID